MSYRQITSGQRYIISTLRKQSCTIGEVGRQLGRHRSTIGRELRRNGCRDGYYRPRGAVTRAVRRRSVSRRNQRFSPEQLHRVEALLTRQWSLCQ